MAINTDGYKLRVRSAIKKQGSVFTFHRELKNKFGEPGGVGLISATLNGLYNETSGYVTLLTGEAARVEKKSQPIIIAVWDDVKGSELEKDDLLEISGTQYKVNAIKDVSKLGIIAQISIEEVENHEV